MFYAVFLMCYFFFAPFCVLSYAFALVRCPMQWQYIECYPCILCSSSSSCGCLLELIVRSLFLAFELKGRYINCIEYTHTTHALVCMYMILLNGFLVRVSCALLLVLCTEHKPCILKFYSLLDFYSRFFFVEKKWENKKI